MGRTAVISLAEAKWLGLDPGDGDLGNLGGDGALPDQEHVRREEGTLVYGLHVGDDVVEMQVVGGPHSD